MHKIPLVSGQGEVDGLNFQSLSFLHCNSYFLTGITSFCSRINNNKVLGL